MRTIDAGIFPSVIVVFGVRGTFPRLLRNGYPACHLRSSRATLVLRDKGRPGASNIYISRHRWSSNRCCRGTLSQGQLELWAKIEDENAQNRPFGVLYSMNCIEGFAVSCHMHVVVGRGSGKRENNRIQDYAMSLTTPPASLIFALQSRREIEVRYRPSRRTKGDTHSAFAETKRAFRMKGSLGSLKARTCSARNARHGQRSGILTGRCLEPCRSRAEGCQ